MTNETENNELLPAAESTEEPNETVEDTGEVETIEPEKAETKEPDWYKKRIDKLTYEKYEAKRQAEQIQAEVAQLREALQQGGQAPQGNVEQLVQQEAARIVQEKAFNDACNRTYEAGVKEFKDFDHALANLQMVGSNREFLEIVSQSDMGAKIIHHLGRDLDEAARIAELPPVRMAYELAKLETQLSTAPKKELSKAPDPIKPIESSKAVAEKDPAKMSDKEFAAWRQRQIANRQ